MEPVGTFLPATIELRQNVDARLTRIVKGPHRITQGIIRVEFTRNLHWCNVCINPVRNPFKPSFCKCLPEWWTVSR